MKPMPTFARLLAAVSLASLLVASARAQGGLLGVPYGGPGQPATKQATPPQRKDFERPTAPKNGPAPFLTEAVDWEIDTYRKFDRAQLFLPRQEKVEQPFYDLPFTINVPFELPFEGGVTRVFFDLNLVWDEPELHARYGDRPLFSGNSWQFHRQGVYRLGGGAISPEAVDWEVTHSEKIKMTVPPSSPFPILLNGEVPSAKNPRPGVTTAVDINSSIETPKPRRPFANPEGQRLGMSAASRPLVFRAAQPGWYALWVTMSARVRGWPLEKLRPKDTLRAKLRVHYIVARRERYNGTGDYFTARDLDYLWEGHDVPVSRPIDPKLVRVHTVEVPVELRRDGWVLDRVEIVRRETMPDQTMAAAGKESVFATVVKSAAAPNALGVTAKFETQSFSRERASDPWPAQPRSVTVLTWDIALPKEIPDGGLGELVAKGTVKDTGYDKPYWERVDAREIDWAELPWWIGSPTSAPTAKDKIGVSHRVPTVANDRDNYLKYWAGKLGDPEGKKYLVQGRTGLVPRSEKEPHRFFLYAETFEADGWFARDPERAKLLANDLGPQPVVNFSFGVWEAHGHYRRKKDLEKISSVGPAGGPTKLVDEKDPFWEWYPRFSALLKQKLLEAQVLEQQVALLREPLQAQRRVARRLLDALQGVGEANGWSDWVFGSSATRATYPPEMEARMMREAGRANTVAQGFRVAAQAHVANIRQAYQAILTEIDRVYPTFIDQHPELVLWRRHYRQALEAVDLQAAVATSDLGLFQAAIAKMEGKSLLPEVLVAQAQLQLENGDAVGALEALRVAARQQVGSTDARDRLRDLECALIKVALEKSQGAIADARNHFFGYLKERGMSGEKHRWVGGVHNPLSALDTESAWAVFSTGVTGSVSALLGRAEEEGRALDAVERDMTTAYLGAQAILRLRMRQHELAAIKNMNTVQLRDALMAGVTNAPPIDLAGARQLGLAIRAAFQLPELAAMIAEDPMALRAGLAKGYWDARMVGNTWAEWVGDITSPKNLVMTLLPMSIGRVGGQLQGVSYWTRAEAGLIQAAAREGYVDTGTMVVARMVGWDRALAAVPPSAADYLTKLLERSQKYQESLGLFGQAGWSLGKVVATMGLQGLAVHQAEQLGGPGAALMMETLLLFGGDTDLLCKFLDAARIPRAVAVKAINQRALPVVQRQLSELRGVQARIPHVQKLLIEMRAGKSLPEARASVASQSGGASPNLPGSATNPGIGARPTGSGTRPQTPGAGKAQNLPPGSGTGAVPGARPTGSGTGPAGAGGAGGASGAGGAGGASGAGGAGGAADDLGDAVTDGRLVGPPPNSRNGIPNGQSGNDGGIAVVAAEEALEQGTDNGAGGAARGFQNQLQQEADDLAKKSADLKALAQQLEATPSSGPIPPRPVGGTGRFDKDVYDYRLPGQPGGNETWAAAERALHEGRYAEAEELFRQMKQKYVRDARANKPRGAQDLHIDVIDGRIEQARALQTLPPPAVDRAKTIAIMESIPDTQVDDILALERKALAHQGVSGEVARTKGAPYIIKRVELGGNLSGTPRDLENVIEAEVVAAELRRAFGIATPGTNVKAQWRVGPDGKPEMVSAQLVYRDVGGKGLDKASVGELYHLRDQVSEDRAISILIGDFDRKPDNYMVIDGVVHALDGGVADVRGLREMAGHTAADPLFISGRNGRDHWYTKAEGLLDHANPAERAMGRQTMLSEMSLTHQAAQRAADRAEKILKDPTQRAELLDRLSAAYKRIYQDRPDFVSAGADALNQHARELAEQAVKAAEARLEPMKNAIRKLNDRNGIPVTSAGAGGRFRPEGRAPAPASIWFFPVEERLAA